MEQIIIEAGKKNTSIVGGLTPAAVDLWKEYAYEFIGQTDHLQNKLCVNYNQWCHSINYRKKIIQNLGIEFTDEGFQKVPSFGGGSSFDKQFFDGCANSMNLMKRYEKFIEHSWYKNLFDDEIKNLSYKIFKFSPF
jgi:hypothetical protein